MTRRAKVAFTVWSALVATMLLAPPGARAIPAFARKYGLRCTACHEAWPKLNDFGRAFRDNGYQMLLGKDDTVTATPGYWPVSIRITPHYEFDEITNQPTDQGVKKLRTGGIAGVGIDLLTAGTLFKDVSFLVVPTGFAPDGAVTLESAWVRFDNMFGSSWLNLKIGQHEVDLPASAHRPWNLSSTGYLIYAFHASGSASIYDMGETQRGIEYVGHDRGSVNRLTTSVFNVQESPGAGTSSTHRASICMQLTSGSSTARGSPPPSSASSAPIRRGRPRPSRATESRFRAPAGTWNPHRSTGWKVISGSARRPRPFM